MFYYVLLTQLTLSAYFTVSLIHLCYLVILVYILCLYLWASFVTAICLSLTELYRINDQCTLMHTCYQNYCRYLHYKMGVGSGKGAAPPSQAAPFSGK